MPGESVRCQCGTVLSAGVDSPSRVPFVIVGVVTVVIAVVILFVVAIGAGVGTVILLVVVVIALAFISATLYRIFVEAWIKFAGMKLKHAEAGNAFELAKLQVDVAKLRLEYDHMPRLSAPVQEQQVAQQAPPDPRREHALRLLSATLDSDKYGPRSQKIMTQADAGKIGIIADDWSAAVAYLFLFGVATGNTGTIIKDSRNVSRLMADVARDKQDSEASGVMALPEVKR
jgi:hypothetical protein